MGVENNNIDQNCANNSATPFKRADMCVTELEHDKVRTMNHDSQQLPQSKLPCPLHSTRNFGLSGSGHHNTLLAQAAVYVSLWIKAAYFQIGRQHYNVQYQT